MKIDREKLIKLPPAEAQRLLQARLDEIKAEAQQMRIDLASWNENQNAGNPPVEIDFAFADDLEAATIAISPNPAPQA